ncbi:MAG: PPOX class F420-dependent oxidoreductase [Acidimicrobiales bacterium]
MLDPTVKRLASGTNFAALTTLFADGRPHTNIMWIDADEDHVIFNTEIHRQKYKNLKRDPRVTIAIVDSGNPYHYAEVRGRVVDEVRGDEAREHIDKLSEKYTSGPYRASIHSERVIIKVEPDYERHQ